MIVSRKKLVCVVDTQLIPNVDEFAEDLKVFIAQEIKTFLPFASSRLCKYQNSPSSGEFPEP